MQDFRSPSPPLTRAVRSPRERGQISILLGMMMMTFILFFAFVVNVGMLVNAKINLQNAADLAAYAGAATQARQLTQISYLNYEMRRQYKKFLFRYYVMGNMAQKTHPRGASGGTRMWSPSGTNSTVYGMPVVCMTFNPGDNFCQVEVLARLQIPNPSPLDAVNNTLIDQLKALESIRLQGCKSIGKTNLQLLNYWLFNSDPNLTVVENALTQAQGNAQAGGRGVKTDLTILKTLKALASGIGLIPREMILNRRIHTIADYINAKPLSGVNTERVNSLKQDADWAKNERTIQAFESAFQTLGTHTFDNLDSIQMTELIPEALDGANLLTLKNITTKFDTFAVEMNSETIPPSPDAADCKPNLVVKPVDLPIPMGVYKDPTILTYYAIKLQAQAKVMFSPFGDVKMTAYAAAKPFGSRIGPQLDGEADFTTGSPKPCIGCTKRIPNLPVKLKDTTKDGWNMNDVIYGTFQGFKTGGAQNGAIPTLISRDDMLRAYDLAMFPNPWESGKYNIIGDLNADPFVKNFEGDAVTARAKLHAIWAPIISPEKIAAGANVRDELTTMIGDMLKGSLLNPTTLSDDFRRAIVKGMEEYYTALQKGEGEDGEGANVVRLSDPFQSLRQATSEEIFLKDPVKVKTSWNAPYDGALREGGRTGYSVKIVPFKYLQSGTSGTGDSWTNIPSGDEETHQDLQKLKH